MNNASVALYVINLSRMENFMKKTKILTVFNTIMNYSDTLALNAIKPSLMVLQLQLLINTGTEITSPAPNVTKLSLMENSSKTKVNHTAKNITIKEEELFAESAANQLMECVSQLLIRNGIKTVSLALNVAMFFLAKLCSLKVKFTAQNALMDYNHLSF